MRVWLLRDLPQSVCIETGNVRDGEIKSHEEEKTKCSEQFGSIKESTFEDIYNTTKSKKLYEVTLHNIFNSLLMSKCQKQIRKTTRSRAVDQNSVPPIKHLKCCTLEKQSDLCTLKFCLACLE